MYDELAESGVIADAAGDDRVGDDRLNISWDLITGTFLGIWNTVTLESLLSPIETFDRIVAAFGDPLNRIAEFVSVVIQVVVRLILELMNFPSELLGQHHRQRDGGHRGHQERPRRLPDERRRRDEGRASSGSSATSPSYLLEGLSGWLFRGLEALGIEPPDRAVARGHHHAGHPGAPASPPRPLWTKLGGASARSASSKIRGASTSRRRVDFIKDVQERGIEAVWEFIEPAEQPVGHDPDPAKDWIMREIVDRAVTRLLSMLDPTGIMAVINGTIAFFNAVQSVARLPARAARARRPLRLDDRVGRQRRRRPRRRDARDAGWPAPCPSPSGSWPTRSASATCPRRSRRSSSACASSWTRPSTGCSTRRCAWAQAALDALIGGDEGDERRPVTWTASSKSGRRPRSSPTRTTRCWSASEEKHDFRPRSSRPAPAGPAQRRRSTPKVGRRRRADEKRRRAVQGLVNKAIDLLKATPTCGTSSASVSGTHPNIGQRRDPQCAGHRLAAGQGQGAVPAVLALESEHVVPDDHVTALFKSCVIAPTIARRSTSNDDW